MNLHDFIARIKTEEPVPGVQMYLDERKGSGYVHAAIAIEAGLWRVTPDMCGIPLVLPHMLDEGTTSRSRDILRRELELLGSDIRFDISGEHLYVRIEGRSDVCDKTFEIAADMLMNSLFSEASLQTVLTRLKSEYDEDREDTRKIAYATATHSLFKDGSAMRAMSPQEKIDAISVVSATSLRAHADGVLRGLLTIAVVGDIDQSQMSHLVRKYFSTWNVSPSSVPLLPYVRRTKSMESHFIEVPNKDNIDVYFVSPTDISIGDTPYVALSVACELLGSGGFTGHLMKTVRERDGLTYGIYARLRDTTSRFPILITIWATFGSSLFEKGVAMTKKEISLWQKRHITKKNLEKKKREIIGSYMVSLQDPQDVTSQIVSTVASGKALTYIAEYPDLVQSLTVKDIAIVAKKYFTASLFSVTSAGTETK